MERSRPIVRVVFAAVIFVLLFLCVGAVLLPASKNANAENTSASRSDDLGEVVVTYVIGDASITDKFGAVFVDESKPEYGMYYEDEENGIFTYSEHEWGWAAAMSFGASASSANERVRVVLASDWIAQRTDRKAVFRNNTIPLITSFGNSESVFPYGRLEVPQGAYISLDLNGNVLDRALTNSVEWFGQVIYGKNCHIEIADGNSENPHKNDGADKYVYQENGETVAVNGGIITGGYTRFYYGVDNYYNYDISGGGIVVNVDSDLPKLGLTLNGGTLFGIRDNHAGRNDGGTSVLLYSTTSGTFTMNDGAAIIKSAGDSSAPTVGVYGEGKLVACNINGGTIAHSAAYTFNVIYAGARLNITGGEIRNNTIKQAVIYAHDATISGGKIFDNDCTYGVISTLGTDSRYSKDKIVMTGGEIYDNRVTEYDSSYVGPAATVYLGNYVDFELNGGRIHHNEVTVEYDGSYPSSEVVAAGGVYVSANNGIFTMNGGEISDNVATAARTSNVSNAGSILVCGGVIIGNTSGGVVSYMNGGTIARNVGRYPNAFTCGKKYAVGGVLVCEGSMSSRNVFEMTGGEIYDNEGIDAASDNYKVVGGVLIAHCGELWMGGGSIVGNKGRKYGAGLHVEGVSYGYFWGKPVIKDNVNTTDESNNNAVIPNFKSIGMFEDGAHININTDTVYPLTDYTYFNNDVYDKKGKYTADDYKTFKFNYCVDPAKYLHCDSDEFIVVLDQANNSATFVNKSALAAKPTFEAAYSTDAEPSLQAIEDYGAKYTYADGAQFKFRLLVGDNDVTGTVKLTNGTGAPVTEITDADKYKLEYQYGSGKIIYNVAVLPRELTADDVTIVLDNSEYKYDGAEKRPTVRSITFDGKQISVGDYSVSYENNVDAGTGYAVIKFYDGGNYSGTIKAPFAIAIDGGQYNVVWQYYNGAEWKTLAENTSIEYLPGARGNQINKVRAQLTASGSGTFTETVYAYADGVVEYNDESLTSTDISTIRVRYKLGGEFVTAFRQVGEYTVSLAGEGKLPYGGAHECSVGIAAYVIEDNELLDARLIGAENYIYDGEAKAPQVTILLDRLALIDGVDYSVAYTDGVNADTAVLGGDAKAIVTFAGNYSGSIELGFRIAQADNKWVTLPNIIRWDYGNFDKNGAVILARPLYLLDDASVRVSILGISGKALDGLDDIKVKRVSDVTYGECYAVDDDGAIAALNALPVSQYLMRVWVEETASYAGLPAEDTVFNIRKSENSWITAPSIKSWTVGEFDAEENMPTAEARFGDVVAITVADAETGVVYFDSGKGINELGGMRAGLYSLTVKVEGTANYGGLSVSQNFKVFERDETTTVVENGMAWWVTILIVIGVLAVIAIVMLILHLKGVLHLITGKMVVKMRANADIDATIAAVRAGRVTAAAAAAGTAAAVEKAEKEEKKTAKRAAALEKKALTPEERAEQLQAKVKAMRARAAAMKMRAQELTMTPEEKREKRNAERAAEKEKQRVKTPEEKAEALERKAETAEEHAEQLRAKAEVMKTRANEMRERAAKRAMEQREAAKARNTANNNAQAKEKEE